MAKGLLARSFVAGAVSAPMLVWALMFASAKSAAGGLPVSIISNPFLDFTTPPGRTVSVSGAWLWVVIALVGGASFTLLAGVIRTLSNNDKQS